jgi:AcrR family transcriptional regulator
LHAAIELVREGRPPSMPEAAERALISVATAYRYFPSAEELWSEAASEALFQPALQQADTAMQRAGDDPRDRLEALVRATGFRMLDDQAPYRRLAKASLELWFGQLDTPEGQKLPVREGRRNRQIARVVEPLRERLPKRDVDRIAHALGVVIGTEAMIALTDGVGLSVPEAKKAMLDAGRWILAGALSELDAPAPE